MEGGGAAEKSVSDSVGRARSAVGFGVFGGVGGFHPVVPFGVRCR